MFGEEFRPQKHQKLHLSINLFLQDIQLITDLFSSKFLCVACGKSQKVVNVETFPVSHKDIHKSRPHSYGEGISHQFNQRLKKNKIQSRLILVIHCYMLLSITVF